MKITIAKDSKCGQVFVPKGEYWVSLSSENGQMVLSSAGKDVKVAATRRRTKSKTRVTSVSFFSVGGPVWSLVVTTPKYGEWVAFLELQDTGRDDEKRRR